MNPYKLLESAARESTATYYHYFYGTRTGINNGGLTLSRERGEQYTQPIPRKKVLGESDENLAAIARKHGYKSVFSPDHHYISLTHPVTNHHISITSGTAYHYSPVPNAKMINKSGSVKQLDDYLANFHKKSESIKENKPMNIQQRMLSNAQHMKNMWRGGPRESKEFKLGEHLRVNMDVDLSVDEAVLSIPRGTEAVVKKNDGFHLTVDLGEAFGGEFTLPIQEVSKYFDRNSKVKESIKENYVVAAPGAYVVVTNYDSNIGPNRGPNSPGFGGYETLVGQKGQIVTVYGTIKGIKTYKVLLVSGGEFVLGETELQVIPGPMGPTESVDHYALRGLGLGLTGL